jgi:hypothetical protein
LITTTRQGLQILGLQLITRVYHLSPVTSPRFLGGLLRQPGFRVNAKLLDGTAIDKGLDSFHENLAAKSHHGNSAGETNCTSCSVPHVRQRTVGILVLPPSQELDAVAIFSFFGTPPLRFRHHRPTITAGNLQLSGNPDATWLALNAALNALPW